jgi:predicted DNA-binding transcriptional regulator YafY
MKVFEYLDRISKMHKLVLRRKTGTPEEFAQQLGVSRTSLYELLDEMKSRGAPIEYSKSCRTFFYRQPFEIAVTCSLRPLSFAEEKELYGGLNIFGSVLFFRTMVSEIC